MSMAVDSAGQTNVKSEPNVVPMIDIMLVLLIIFMIVTPLISAGFKATMPKGANLDPDPEKDNEVVLGIDDRGNYFIDARPVHRFAAAHVGGIVEADAVDQHQALRIVGPADEDAGRLAEPARRRNGNARQAGQHIDRLGGLPAHDLVMGDDRHRLADLADRHRGAGGGDDDGAGAGFVGQCRARQQEGGGGEEQMELQGAILPS